MNSQVNDITDLDKITIDNQICQLDPNMTSSESLAWLDAYLPDLNNTEDFTKLLDFNDGNLTNIKADFDILDEPLNLSIPKSPKAEEQDLIAVDPTVISTIAPPATPISVTPPATTIIHEQPMDVVQFVQANFQQVHLENVNNEITIHTLEPIHTFEVHNIERVPSTSDKIKSSKISVDQPDICMKQITDDVIEARKEKAHLMKQLKIVNQKVKRAETEFCRLQKIKNSQRKAKLIVKQRLEQRKQTPVKICIKKVPGAELIRVNFIIGNRNLMVEAVMQEVTTKTFHQHWKKVIRDQFFQNELAAFRRRKISIMNSFQFKISEKVVLSPFMSASIGNEFIYDYGLYKQLNIHVYKC